MSSHDQNRRAVLTTIATVAAMGSAGLLATPASARARGNPQAEQFVQTEAQKMFSVLADRSLSGAAKEAAFRQVVDKVADLGRISAFVLGKYARNISPEQRQRFNAAFRIYVQGLYQTHLQTLSGDQLKVTGSVARSPRDTIVNTVVSGGANARPLPVAWRILGSAGAFKVVDVQAQGVWLAITLQQDFVSTIDNARGDVDVLISRLESSNQSQGGRRS